MAFKFYIVDPDQGEVFGTDSTGVAKKAATSSLNNKER